MILGNRQEVEGRRRRPSELNVTGTSGQHVRQPYMPTEGQAAREFTQELQPLVAECCPRWCPPSFTSKLNLIRLGGPPPLPHIGGNPETPCSGGSPGHGTWQSDWKLSDWKLSDWKLSSQGPAQQEAGKIRGRVGDGNTGMKAISSSEIIRVNDKSNHCLQYDLWPTLSPFSGMGCHYQGGN